MFTHEKNAVDMFQAMNNGSLILINTAKGFLQPPGCQLLGRFFIALIAQATQEREVIPENQRKPTMVYIDEAHEYFDETMELLFVTARKYKVALTVAHQSLVQLDTRLRKIILGNTSTKIVGGLTSDDAAVFAKEMNSEPEQLMQSAKKIKNGANFVAFTKDVTSIPKLMPIRFGLYDEVPKLDDDEFDVLIDGNSKRISPPMAKESLRAANVMELTKPDLI